MRPVIQVEQLSKHYRLGLIGGGTLREDLHRWWAKARGRPDPLLKIGQDDHGNREGGELWALRDVSFQVQEGEILGIIGRNGAGKSTLLKILSRITAPTTGQVKIRGRVGSLLEVGTGFHPELTGRENIYLNGAILGMKKAEIDRKLDEIIDFAEIEPFIDTPVKRYSSGMYVRLAFAVAAHLEPEILVVDEVLAVGDAGFQKKCLGRMHDVAEGGRTVLFVSHNMPAVQALCSRAISLDRGLLQFEGSVLDSIAYYRNSLQEQYPTLLDSRMDRKGNGTVRIKSICINDLTGNESINSASSLVFRIKYETEKQIKNMMVKIGVYDAMDSPIFGLDNEMAGFQPTNWPKSGVVECKTSQINITAGRCVVNVAIFCAGDLADYLPHATYFDVEACDFFGTGKVPTREWTLGILQQDWIVTNAGDI